MPNQKMEPLTAEEVKAVFAAAPELKRMGALSGSTAMLLEHGIENKDGRWSLDIDLHSPQEWNKNQSEIIAKLLPLDKNTKLERTSEFDGPATRYEITVGTKKRPKRIQIEICHPTLQHLKPPQASQHIAGLKVVQIIDTLMGKLDAAAGRGFPRDFYDLFLMDEQKKIHWDNVFKQAAGMPEHSYTPENLRNNIELVTEDLEEYPEHWENIPVNRPRPEAFNKFLRNLEKSNEHFAHQEEEKVRREQAGTKLKTALAAGNGKDVLKSLAAGAHPLHPIADGKCGIELAAARLDTHPTAQNREILQTLLDHCPNKEQNMLHIVSNLCNGRTSQDIAMDWMGNLLAQDNRLARER